MFMFAGTIERLSTILIKYCDKGWDAGLYREEGAAATMLLLLLC